MAKARQPAFIAEVPRFVQWSGAEISATRHGSSHYERFVPSDASVLVREKWKLAPKFKYATPLTLPGLAEPSH